MRFQERAEAGCGIRRGTEVKCDLAVVFVKYIPEGYREKYETDYKDSKTGVTVKPVFAATGN
jgi:hypothetical protein